MSLIAAAASELFQRWRIDREPGSAWLATTGICAAAYAGVSAIWVFMVPVTTSVTVDFVDLGVSMALLAMFARALSTMKTMETLPPGGPLVFGLTLAAFGVGLRVVVAQHLLGSGTDLGTVAYSGAFVVAGLLAATVVHRSPDFTSPDRRLLVFAVGLATVGRVLMPHEYPQAGLRTGAAAVLVLAACALFRSQAASLLDVARRGQAIDNSAVERELLGHDPFVTHDRSEQLHELRAGLAGISSGVHLLGSEDRAIDSARRLHLVAMLEAEVGRLERLIDPSDHFTRVVDLDASMEPVIERIRLSGQEIDWTPSGHRVLGVPDLVQETLSILLSNAAAHAPGARVQVSVDADPDEVRIRVSDNGPGVPTDLRGQIFERGVTTAPGTNSGLGLSLAQRLVSAQGGSLSLATSHDASGASFIVSLPPPVNLSTDHPVPEAIK